MPTVALVMPAAAHDIPCSDFSVSNLRLELVGLVKSLMWLQAQQYTALGHDWHGCT